MRRTLRNAAAALAIALLVPAVVYAGQVITGTVSLNFSFVEAVTGVTNYSIPATISSNLSYANGTGSNAVDTLYAKQIALVASTPQTIDLTSLTDPAGNSINFARVREFIVQNTSSTAGNDVKVEAGASNGWSVLPPSSNPLYARYSGTLRISDPVSTGGGNGNVVSGASKTITFDPGSANTTINVVIVGGSAA
jgi:hypothetical protein